MNISANWASAFPLLPSSDRYLFLINKSNGIIERYKKEDIIKAEGKSL